MFYPTATCVWLVNITMNIFIFPVGNHTWSSMGTPSSQEDCGKSESLACGETKAGFGEILEYHHQNPAQDSSGTDRVS